MIPEREGLSPTFDMMMEIIREKQKNTELSEKIKNLEEKSLRYQETITSLTKEVEVQKEISNVTEDNYLVAMGCLQDDLYIIRGQNDANAKNCLRIIGEWQGRSVRLNWIIKEMERVGAIKGDHEWAQDLRRSIEFPNDDGINLGESVYTDIPNDVLIRNLPNYMDSHMEEVDEDTENERIEELSEEARSFVEQEKISACIIIQEMWRKKREKILYHWIDSEDDSIFGELFDEDERAYTLQWKDMYRKHYEFMIRLLI